MLLNAFKSLRTDPISNNLRRFFFTDIYDENKTTIREEDMMIFRPTVLSFGSALSSPFLDLARIMFVSKKVEFPESQKCIINNFYVDDACLLSDCKEKLDKIYKDVNQAFTYYNFIVKPPMISYQKEKQIDKYLVIFESSFHTFFNIWVLFHCSNFSNPFLLMLQMID